MLSAQVLESLHMDMVLEPPGPEATSPSPTTPGPPAMSSHRRLTLGATVPEQRKRRRREHISFSRCDPAFGIRRARYGNPGHFPSPDATKEQSPPERSTPQRRRLAMAPLAVVSEDISEGSVAVCRPSTCGLHNRDSACREPRFSPRVPGREPAVRDFSSKFWDTS